MCRRLVKLGQLELNGLCIFVKNAKKTVFIKNVGFVVKIVKLDFIVLSVSRVMSESVSMGIV